MSPVIDGIVKLTKKQFYFNSHKNIFCIVNQLAFSAKTKQSINYLRNVLHSLTQKELDHLTKNYIKQFLSCFYEVDQYIYFNKHAFKLLNNIYTSLLEATQNINLNVYKIEYRHYNRIKHFIKNTNPTIYKINHNINTAAHNFICAKYSAQFQLDLLKIDLKTIKEPVLDMGCGQHANIVKFLRSLGIKAYGIDRILNNNNNTNYIKCADWFNINYGHNHWGTIISNLSFSSHFLHHHLQNDCIDISFAKTYMNILSSLTHGGKWIYAPSITFIENLLPATQYKLQRTYINKNFCKTVITKK